LLQPPLRWRGGGVLPVHADQLAGVLNLLSGHEMVRAAAGPMFPGNVAASGVS